MALAMQKQAILNKAQRARSEAEMYQIVTSVAERKTKLGLYGYADGF